MAGFSKNTIWSETQESCLIVEESQFSLRHSNQLIALISFFSLVENFSVRNTRCRCPTVPRKQRLKFTQQPLSRCPKQTINPTLNFVFLCDCRNQDTNDSAGALQEQFNKFYFAFCYLPSEFSQMISLQKEFCHSLYRQMISYPH